MKKIRTPLTDYHGVFSNKRMNLQPMIPIPVNYATAAVPRYAPFGTEYTPDQKIKIIGSRYVTIPEPTSYGSQYLSNLLTRNIDPDLAPSKAIQTLQEQDTIRWQHEPSTQKFDTTYRSEYINRIRHPEYVPWYQQLTSDQIAKPVRNTKSSLNQFSILPPISSAKTNVSTISNVTNATTTVVNGSTIVGSARPTRADVQQPPPVLNNQEPITHENTLRSVPPLNIYNSTPNLSNHHQQQQQLQSLPPAPPPPQFPQPIVYQVDTYLPEEPIILTDYEEQRLAEQITTQLGYSNGIEKLKLFYRELTAYDPHLTNCVHYSTIQSLAQQLGLNLQKDTLRFAMCKFVLPERARGYVNYEDMIRYFSRCLANVYPNQYRQTRTLSSEGLYDNGSYNRLSNVQIENHSRMKFGGGGGGGIVNDEDRGEFDPDERQARFLLKQNLKYFDVNGAIDFDKLYREFQNADRNRTGVLNRQQIEEVVYKVRIPIQRSLIFQILEKHCRAYLRFYRWEAFFQYLRQQVLDVKDVQDRSSPVYTQNSPTRNHWLNLMQQEYNERDRLRIIERFTTQTEGPRLESNNPTAWFARFLRLANAMYSHRASTNREHDFLLPRDEARRLFRAYNQVWDLKIDDDKLQRVIDSCARGGNTAIDDALKLLAK